MCNKIYFSVFYFRLTASICTYLGNSKTINLKINVITQVDLIWNSSEQYVWNFIIRF